MSDTTESKGISPKWGTPEEVLQVTELMQAVETRRALERAKLDSFANGDRPWTDADVTKYGIQLNVNWLELTSKLIGAIGQINNAFIPNGNFFTCHSEGGEPAKKPRYGQKFTKRINRILKRGPSGRRHHFLLRSRNACVALHGIGPLMWTNKTRLFPRFVPLEDLLIPTDTMLDFSTNLSHFAVNLYLTPGELYRMALLGSDEGWNKTAVRNILKDLRTDKGVSVFAVQNESDWDRPEAITEIYKQNRGFLESDSVPKTRLRAFYYQDPEANDDGEQLWHRKIILRDNTPKQESKAEFIYDGKAEFAEDVSHILHCQFGDNSLIPPLKYHSVRGLGIMLYAPSFTLNKLRCQAVQHTFQNLQTWFRINDPTDRDRAKAILLMANGILPEGAQIIPQQERHQIDSRLLEFAMAQMKQNISENSTSYAPGLDNGTSKERTKFEVQAQLQASSAMIGNVLSMMYAQEIFYYEELVRRILLKNSDDPFAKAFQKQCEKDGIPKELMVPENWWIVPERVLGAGDNALAQAQADALMGQKQSYEPDAQRTIQRLWTSTTLDDPDRALELVPEEQDKSTSGTRIAEQLYGTLMRGVQVPMRKGIDHVGYVSALLSMMELEIQRIMQTDGMGTPEDLLGFATVAKSIGENLQFLSGDEKQKQAVRAFGDKLGELLNLVKAMGQRQQEAAAKAAQAQQMDPAVMAKIQADGAAAQQKLQINEASNAQKMQQRQEQFNLKMEQQIAKLQADLATQQQKTQANLADQTARTQADLADREARTQAELQAAGMETAADLQAKGMQTAADVKAIELKTSADAAATKARAKATPKEKPASE